MTEPRDSLPSEPELSPDDADILVGMGEWASAESEQIIATDGLATCVGVAVYDPVLQCGYVAHTFGAELKTVESMIYQAEKDGVILSRSLVWLSGAVLEEGYLHDIREEAIGLFENKATGTIHTSWSDGMDYTGQDIVTSMTLDTATGKCGIAHETMSDYSEDWFEDNIE